MNLEPSLILTLTNVTATVMTVLSPFLVLQVCIILEPAITELKEFKLN